jgi:phosphatidate cytidylyltransferase
MLRTRILTATVLIPIAFLCIYRGALPFLALVLLLLTVSEIEFCRLVAHNGFRPTLAFGLGLVWLWLVNAQLTIQFPTLELELLQPGLTLILLGSLAWQIFHRQNLPVVDWALTITGGLYLGLCGACLIGLRGLRDGLWWTLTAIPAIMIADTGAYLVGRMWGRRKLAPTLSPGKTWEGYLAGMVAGGPLTALLASLWHIEAGATTSINIAHGLALGVLIATLAPMGDLAVSMIKRQAGTKDSGKIIPGHGGALDRVDSILWAAVIGYYYVQIFAP